MAVTILLMGLLTVLSAALSVGMVTELCAKEFKIAARVGCVSTDAREVVGD